MRIDPDTNIETDITGCHECASYEREVKALKSKLGKLSKDYEQQCEINDSLSKAVLTQADRLGECESELRGARFTLAALCKENPDGTLYLRRETLENLSPDASIERTNGIDGGILYRVAEPRCEHEWVDARNKVVTSGELCIKCGTIRHGNRATDVERRCSNPNHAELGACSPECVPVDRQEYFSCDLCGAKVAWGKGHACGPNGPIKSSSE